MVALETIMLGARPTLAIATGGRHIPLAAAGARLGLPFEEGSLHEQLQRWQATWPTIAGIAERAGEVHDLAIGGARAVTQFGSTRKIICAGANYYKHLAEMDVKYEKDASKPPFFFLKPPSALTGPGRTLPLDPAIQMLDWEVELTAIIGKGGRNIAAADALAHIAGYTVAVDVSARDRQFQPDSIFKFDFLAGKGQDGYCPTAHGMIPAALLGDPQRLQLKLAVNGVMKQDESTSDMVYSVAELVMWASRLMTLEPGDLLLTGSPAGVGFPRREFLHAGDVMRVELAPHLAYDVEVYTPPAGRA